MKSVYPTILKEPPCAAFSPVGFKHIASKHNAGDFEEECQKSQEIGAVLSLALVHGTNAV